MTFYPKSKNFEKLSEEISEKIEWIDAKLRNEIIYESLHHSKEYKIRINDFPEEVLYTLIIDDEEIMDFDDWPDYWKRPIE